MRPGILVCFGFLICSVTSTDKGNNAYDLLDNSHSEKLKHDKLHPHEKLHRDEKLHHHANLHNEKLDHHDKLQHDRKLHHHEKLHHDKLHHHEKLHHDGKLHHHEKLDHDENVRHHDKLHHHDKLQHDGKLHHHEKLHHDKLHHPETLHHHGNLQHHEKLDHHDKLHLEQEIHEKTDQSKHDEKAHHRAQHHEKAHHIHHHSAHSRHRIPRFRDGNANSSNSLEILYRGNVGLIGISKKSANVSIIFDYTSSLVALLDGQNGTLLLIDSNSSVVYQLQYNENTRNVVWLASSNSFEYYFSNLESLKAVEQIAEQYGSRSSLSELSTTDNSKLHQLVSNLGFEGCSCGALKLFSTFLKELKGKLRILYQNNGSFTTPNTLEWFIKVNLAFGYLLDSSGDSQVSGQVQFDLSRIFSSSSGLEALVCFLGQIGQRVDLTREFPNLFSNPDQALKLLGEVSGGSHNGLDGMITIWINIIKLTQGQGSLGDVFNSITHFNATPLGDTNLTAIENEVIQLVESQNRMFNNSAQLQGFISILRQIYTGNYVWNNINLSDVVKVLSTNNPSSRLDAIITIIRRFAPNGINQFCSYIVRLLNSTQGVNIIQRLFPGINLDISNGSGNILEDIAHRYNFTQLLSGNSNITSALTEVPIFGQIFSRIASTFGQGFENFFNASNFANDFQQIFRGFLDGFGNTAGSGGFFQGFGNIIHNIEDAFGSIFGNGGSGSGSDTNGSSSNKPDSNGPGTNGPGTNGPDTNGPGTNGPGTNGPVTNGLGTNELDTSGSSSYGSSSNGSSSNGSSSNGSSSNDSSSNGSSSNGSSSNGSGSNGSSSNGSGSNGSSSNGSSSNGSSSNGSSSNGSSSNGYGSNGSSSNGSGSNGSSSNGYGSNGYGSNGSSSNGSSSNGSSSNGSSSNGSSSNGSSSNGSSSNGSSSNGSGSNGSSSNGSSSNGSNSNGYGSNGYGSNGYSFNGSSSNGSNSNEPA